MPPNPLISRLVVLRLSCGDCPIAALPPQLDPDPGDVITCVACGRDATVLAVTPHADLDADTPILHGGDTP
jgi:hypothetical protein